MHILARLLVDLGPTVNKLEHRVGIRRAGIEGAIHPAAGLRQVPECLDIEPRDQHLVAGILEEASLRQGHRRPITRTDSDHGHPVTRRLQLGGFSFSGGHRLARGHHQYITGILAGLLQQATGRRQPEIHARPLCRHDAGRQGDELCRDGRGIVGQRRHHEGVAGVGQQGGLPILTGLEEIVDLEAGALQPIGFDIGGLHRPREVQHDDHSRQVAKYRGWQPLPSGPGQGQNGDQPGHPGQPEREPGLLTGTSDQHIRHQSFIAILRPVPLTSLAASKQPQHAHQPNQS